MATKICHIVLIVVLLSSIHLGMSAPDWVSELTNGINRDINARVQGIQEQVQQLTRNLNSQIENSLRPALAEVNRAVENLPRDAQGRIISNGQIITNGGNIISINSSNGRSRTVMSGRTPDGEPYVRNIEEYSDEKYLYHNEISFNPRTNSTEKIRWKLDMTIPGAQPEIITDDQ